MNIYQKRLKVLEDTKNFYNLSNRAVNKETSDCQYHYKGKRCAIGRLLDVKLAKTLESQCSNKSVSADCIVSKLPKNVLELGNDFLSILQSLHDSKSYWDKNGMSQYGLDRYNDIKNQYCTEPLKP